MNTTDYLWISALLFENSTNAYSVQNGGNLHPYRSRKSAPTRTFSMMELCYGFCSGTGFNGRGKSAWEGSDVQAVIGEDKVFIAVLLLSMEHLVAAMAADQ